MIAGWVAIGASLSAALAGAAALCVALPILGWFIGLPIVFGIAMLAACFWVAVFGTIVAAWICTAMTVAVVGVARQVVARAR